ncbi:hypothetical protein D3C81_1849570 [compost metagenome]
MFELLACTFESDHQLIFVERFEEFANSIFIESIDVFEGEHQIFDRTRKLWIVFLYQFNSRFRRFLTQFIEQFRNSTRSADLHFV